MKTDVVNLKLIQKQKLNGVSQSNLAPGTYVGQKTSKESDLFTRSSRTERFKRVEGTPKEGSDCLIFAQVSVVHPKAKKARISVPVDYLSWSINDYFSFVVNMQGFANFRDEALTKTQAETLMAEVIE